MQQDRENCALLTYSKDRDIDKALQELEKAKKLWDEVGKDIASGDRRILVFRRYFYPNGLTFWQALKGIISA